MDIREEMECLNKSQSNKVRNLEKDHETYLNWVRKKFDLEDWYEIVEEQLKCKTICALPQLRGLKSSKINERGRGHYDTFTPRSKELGQEDVGGRVHPEDRKAAKRKAKKKANNTNVDLVTKDFKMLGTVATNKI